MTSPRARSAEAERGAAGWAEAAARELAAAVPVRRRVGRGAGQRLAQVREHDLLAGAQAAADLGPLVADHPGGDRDALTSACRRGP